MKHNDIDLLRDLPNTVALEAYKWFLQLSTKGTVARVAESEGKIPYGTWKRVRNTIRWDPVVLRLWKPIATLKIRDCKWCCYFLNGKCRKRSCKFNNGGERNKFKHSIVKASRIFEFPVKEILFIITQLSAGEKGAFFGWVEEEVSIVVTPREEDRYYERIYKDIFSKLKSQGHFKSKIKKSQGIITHLGEDAENIELELIGRVGQIVRRYDYLSHDKLIKTCSTSMTRKSINIQEGANAQKRKTNLRLIESRGEDLDIATIVDNKTDEDALDPEQVLIQKDTREKIFEVIRGLEGELGKATEIMLGRADKEFIKFLKKKREIKTRAGWESYYNKVSPDRLGELWDVYMGFSAREKIIKLAESKNVIKHIEEKGDLEEMANKSVNNKSIGGKTMATIKVTFPKKKCIMCAYWIPYLNKKKRTPKDCSPAYPGCPVHVYEMEYQFPVKAAAVQLRRFQTAEDGEALKEFFEKIPAQYLNKVLELAANLTEEDLDDLIIEDEDDDDMPDLDDMNHAEMLAFVGQNNLARHIDDCYKLSEDELREKIRELYEMGVIGDDESEDVDDDEDEDDDDDDSTVIGTISPSK